MRSSVDHLPEAEQARVSAWADQLGDRATTRALELVGDALLEMRQAPDARIPLEVALVKITQPATDSSVAALAERIDRLERALAGGAVPPAAAPANPPPAAASTSVAAAPPEDRTDTVSPPSTAEDAPSGAAAARAALQAQRGSAAAGRGAPPPRPRPSTKASEPARAPAAPAAPRPPADEPAPAPDPTPAQAPASPEPAPAAPPPASTAAGSSVTLDQLVAAWPQIHAGLKAVVRGRFSDGGFTAVDGDAATFAVRSEIMRGKCEEKRGEVESALGAHFGRPLSLALVVDSNAAGPRAAAGGPVDDAPSSGDDEADVGDVHALEDAPDGPRSSVDALTQAFPGAQLIEPES